MCHLSQPREKPGRDTRAALAALLLVAVSRGRDISSGWVATD